LKGAAHALFYKAVHHDLWKSIRSNDRSLSYLLSSHGHLLSTHSLSPKSTGMRSFRRGRARGPGRDLQLAHEDSARSPLSARRVASAPIMGLPPPTRGRPPPSVHRWSRRSRAWISGGCCHGATSQHSVHRWRSPPWSSQQGGCHYRAHIRDRRRGSGNREVAAAYEREEVASDEQMEAWARWRVRQLTRCLPEFFLSPYISRLLYVDFPWRYSWSFAFEVSCE
jgi:hypothetical protein